MPDEPAIITDDQMLRDMGFLIVSRPRRGEPLWKRAEKDRRGRPIVRFYRESEAWAQIHAAEAK